MIEKGCIVAIGQPIPAAAARTSLCGSTLQSNQPAFDTATSRIGSIAAKQEYEMRRYGGKMKIAMIS